MRKNKHFRRIPDYIEQELRNIQGQHVIVAAIINIQKTDIARGAYRHLDIKMVDGTVQFPYFIYPEKMVGIYARRNRNGIVRILKDLPKVIKTFSFDSPNFGDPDKGYHTIVIDREVYQRLFEPPREWAISISLVSQDEKQARIRVQTRAILDRQNPDFRRDLFFAINLLQEQCRDCHVFRADISDDELARITTVGWEIFPPGTMDRAITAITSRLRVPSPQRQREIEHRAYALANLHPTEYIVGSGMNSHYFGAKFGENIVAFENIDYGNALYILFDNWQEISQMSRIDILKRHERDFIRIIHKDGWQKVLKRRIDELKDQ